MLAGGGGADMPFFDVQPELGFCDKYLSLYRYLSYENTNGFVDVSGISFANKKSSL
jgi:hypothetical protein